MAQARLINWAGGEHEFLLRIGELRALDDRCEGGAMAAWLRLRTLTPRFDDVFETVRQGLIGAGMSKLDATRLVEKIEDQRGLGPMIPLATEILFRAFHRREEVDDEAGETKQAAESPTTA